MQGKAASNCVVAQALLGSPFVTYLARLLWLALLVLGLGCDRDARTRAEARTFLSVYESIEHGAPLAERERKIAQLEQLTLSDEGVRRARDDCVGAHRALARAEREHEQAARELEKAIAAQPDGAPLPAGETERIRGGIEQAERSLGDARGRFQRCEQEVRDLSLRYAQR